ncbi:PREDICTED: immunoglobulin superfamily member 10-like [Cyprinodon variegatus]|uniref:immunoglobulin superfamily member 10-like n=1 Tax=Cyprinodon variegatus TaxID=28743 RepID=UPI000742632B|nr:PREDICTED: immunoglobulin superfamily member 10-like [Cyprinodon variegatus]
MRAEPGSSVTLPCRPAENKTVRYVAWTRTDLKDGMYAILYRDPHVNPDDTCGSFKNRVNLKDVTNRDASLILTNVTAADTGTYECIVKWEGDQSDSKIISIIGLKVKPDQRTIRVKYGETVTLPCTAPRREELDVAEWSRADLESDQYVILFSGNRVNDDSQSPSFKDRVKLQDVKNGSASLILRMATPEDSGTYECRVVQGGNSCKKRSILDTDLLSIITLIVDQGESDCFWIRTSSSFLVLM